MAKKPLKRMAKKVTKKSAGKRAAGSGARAGAVRETPSVASLLDALQRASSKKTLEEMSSRYGVVTKKAFGVPVGKIQTLGKSVGKDHGLALALWETGWYEARLLAVFVAEPARVTGAEMERWCGDFDNWGICDTACFHLWDRLPTAGLADAKIKKWATSREEFVKRAAFALIASIALHQKKLGDEVFLKYVPMAVRAADDERNFVKKGVSWALRGMGRRKGATAIRAAVIEAAEKLAASEDATERWVGNDVVRDLGKTKGKK